MPLDVVEQVGVRGVLAAADDQPQPQLVGLLLGEAGGAGPDPERPDERVGVRTHVGGARPDDAVAERVVLHDDPLQRVPLLDRHAVHRDERGQGVLARR